MVPALTIARSLARRGCDIATAGHEQRPICGRSRYVRAVFVYPDPLADEEGFLRWLAEHCAQRHYDLVIPVTERSLVPISKARERFEHVHIAMPAAESLELALDKEQTMALASRVGVPVPGGVAITTLEDLDRAAGEIHYPVVLKPARSVGSDGRGSSQLKVSYAFDEAELRSGCVHALRFGPILLQEYFQGQGVGIELIARQGEIAYAFQHLRLHEVPLTGGGSTLRKSQPIEPLLLDAAERLVSALEWNGVAMVEFKWDPETRTFCLMEINGRFWGSLPLADAAGADFPAMLLDLELKDRVDCCKPYRPDVYCRKLSSDLFWYEAVIRSGSESAIVNVPGAWEIFKELQLFFYPRHHYDVQSWRDPWPGVVDLGIIAVSYWQRAITLTREKLFFARQKRAWRSGEVARAVSEAGQLLFICYGNINRSALADRLVRGYAEDSGIAVASAGFHSEAGRPADPVMVEVAAERGTSLGGSRSTTVDREMLRQSDVIFVMEKAHVDVIREMDEEAAARSYLLGAHGGRPEIADPYGGSRGNYEHCYRQIADAVDQLKSVLACRQVE